MKKTLFSLAAAVLLLAAQSATAQTATPGINAEQSVEKARIHQGVRSGELTPAEAARLRGREANITQDKRAAKADGVVTRAERKEIKGDERRTNKAIYRQKHDAQVR